MSATFITASGQSIRNASTRLPTTGHPLTLAGWFKSTIASVTQSAFGFYNPAGGATTDLMEFAFSQTNTIRCQQIDSAGLTGGVNTTGVTVLNQWYFILARFISSTSRRMHVLNVTGGIESVQNTTSISPANMTTIAVGVQANSIQSFFLNGNAAEIWYSNTDVWGSDTVPDDPFIRQLAFGGPFSIPSVALKVLEYRSLREGPVSRRAENKQANSGASWITSVSVPGIGQNPPLPYWYKRPAEDISSLAMV